MIQKLTYGVDIVGTCDMQAALHVYQTLLDTARTSSRVNSILSLQFCVASAPTHERSHLRAAVLTCAFLFSTS